MLVIFNKLSLRTVARIVPIVALVLASCTHEGEAPTPVPVPLPSPIENSTVVFDLSATMDKVQKVSLSWKAQTGNPTYRILRSTNLAQPTYDLVGETKETTFDDLNVLAKSTYYYKIQAQYSATKVVEGVDVVIGQTREQSDSEAIDEAYDKLATATGGKRYDVTSASVLPETIIKIIKENAGDANADIVLLMDNTGSMADDIDAVKKAFNKIIDALPASTRLGAGGYRDHGDLYVLRFQDLTTDFSVIRTFINKMTANGGGDLPEAVYDAVYGTVTQATWANKKRIVIVVGDAPPQEGDKTDHSYAEVVAKCRQAGVDVNLYPILIKDPTNDEAVNK